MSDVIKTIGRGVLAASSLGATVFVGALVEAHAFTVRRFEIPVLPHGQSPIHVLHLSDLHLMARQTDKLAFLRELDSLAPDLVISTGDHLSQAAALGPMVGALDGLLTRPGAFVFGSNDFTEPSMVNPLRYLIGGSAKVPRSVRLPWRATRDALLARGWADLNNQSARLQVAGRTIDLRGTSDAHRNQDDYDAVAGPPATDADLTFGVTHAPYRRVLDAMVADGLPLILAGHTHGGQVCLPGGRAIVTNCDLPPAQARGVSRWRLGDKSAWLHVSAGLGTSPYAPYRLFCRPEVSLLTLVSR